MIVVPVAGIGAVNEMATWPLPGDAVTAVGAAPGVATGVVGNQCQTKSLIEIVTTSQRNSGSRLV